MNEPVIRSSFHRSYSSASDVDSVMLQSQVTTLQWQLRQAEASRQMYRAVMEQVLSFLQKTHKNLDVLQNQMEYKDSVDNVSRLVVVVVVQKQKFFFSTFVVICVYVCL